MKKQRPTSWDAVPVIFDLDYAAYLLGLSPEYLRKKATCGKFPARKLGGIWRVEKDTFIDYVKNGGI